MGAVMPFVSLATTVVGGIFSAIGQQRQAQANANAANYNAAVARNAATYAQQAGEIRAQASDRATAAAVGRARAVAAAGNLDVNFGSPLDIQAGNAAMGRFNSMTIRNNAAREAWGQNAQANLYDFEGQNDITAGNYAAAGSLIGAGTSVGDKWSQYSRAGVDPFAAFAFG